MFCHVHISGFLSGVSTIHFFRHLQHHSSAAFGPGQDQNSAGRQPAIGRSSRNHHDHRSNGTNHQTNHLFYHESGNCYRKCSWTMERHDSFHYSNRPWCWTLFRLFALAKDQLWRKYRKTWTSTSHFFRLVVACIIHGCG